MEPVDSAPAIGATSVPDRADTAQRKLAEIWGGRRTAADQKRRGTAQQDPERAKRLALISRLGDEVTELSQAAGPDDPKTVDAQLALAAAQLDAGQDADAVALLEQALAAIDPGDASAAGTLTAVRATLANACLATRRPRRAIELYDVLLANPSPGAAIASYRVRRAVAVRAAGEAGAAIEQLQALATELQASRADEEALLEAWVELAKTHAVAGRPLEGMAQYERALRLAEVIHGADHLTPLGIRLLIARAHVQGNQPERALAVYEQLVLDAGRALGPHDRLTEQVQRELSLLRATRS